ncbi:protein kinase [Theileria orientalis strain Shintoku]|uniref:Cyclin-dependent kinase 2 homolog n=1 Tax=Theileria orientalis strain Shintoku TaxID=869250 RepID=J4DPX2_THEOR|nr:protein kinase [Theileria orientalis strain Shintoku]PVC53760.1 protein kinase [Theileria orientalis]BAM41449.1 protein kinase [Theileria orientalis strain Shintoku]|eukprot:XP_009691750.1 protein kinase [Theileria orientalis strain Shintoku]
MIGHDWPGNGNSGGGPRPLQLKLESYTQPCLAKLKRHHTKLILSRISNSLDKILDSLSEERLKDVYEEVGVTPEGSQDFLSFLESLLSFSPEGNSVALMIEKLKNYCTNDDLLSSVESIRADWASITSICTDSNLERYTHLVKSDLKEIEPLLVDLEHENRPVKEEPNQFKRALSSLKPIRLGNFVKIHQVGQGAYGDVWLAEDIVNKVPVALKKLKLNEEREGFPKNAIREILLLNSLKHKNIVDLLGISYSKTYDSSTEKTRPDGKDAQNESDERKDNQGDDKDTPRKDRPTKVKKDPKGSRRPDKQKENVWMVFEYLPFDLSGYLEALRDKSDRHDVHKMHEGDMSRMSSRPGTMQQKPNARMNKWEKMLKPTMWLSIGEIKGIMFQLLRGLAFCHKNNVLHRDLKTANLLMSNEGIIKLADFGLARFLPHGKGILTNRVVTLWYRPPELLLGSEKYDFAVDLWSVGCIMAELVSGAHVFAADRESAILKLICEHIGLPDEADFKYLKTLPNFNDRMLNPLHPDRISSLVTKEREFENIFLNKNQLGKDGWDLLKKLFSWSPSRRISAADALKHPWFQRDPLMTLIKERKGIKDAHSFMTKNQKKRETMKTHQKPRDYVKYANTGEIRKVLSKFEKA